MFKAFQRLFEDILSGDCLMSLDRFEEKVQVAYEDGSITGAQYDLLIANLT